MRHPVAFSPAVLASFLAAAFSAPALAADETPQLPKPPAAAPDARGGTAPPAPGDSGAAKEGNAARPGADAPQAEALPAEPAPGDTGASEKEAAEPDEEEKSSGDKAEASAGPASLSLGKDGLLSLGGGDKEKKPAAQGFLQQETAYTYATPGHLSTAVIRAQVGSSGTWGENLKWRASVRGEFDPVYTWSDFYPDAARTDQRLYGLIGETYIDTSLKGWDLRLGRQNIVWGEMVGLYFADVVTAKDLRHFILPGFDIVRIPQWAVRGEYFLKDAHVELIWIPVTSFDRIGKPGSEFFPFRVPPPDGFSQSFRNDQLPARSLSNSNVGARFSALRGGVDFSAFAYSSMDSSATFYREILPTSPTTGEFVYTPRHDRITQFGGTMSKEIGSSTIFKAEAVYTTGRRFNVTRPEDDDGVVKKNAIDYAMGIDHTLPDDSKLNLQLFQRVFVSHDSTMLQDRFETGVTAQYTRKLVPKMDGEVLWIQSLNRWENLIRPRIVWRPEQNLRVAFGVDVFNGPVTGYLGRFRDRDRIYIETRYDF